MHSHCVFYCVYGQIHICGARRPIRVNVLHRNIIIFTSFGTRRFRKNRRTTSKTTVHQFITSLHLRSNILIQFSVVLFLLLRLLCFFLSLSLFLLFDSSALQFARSPLLSFLGPCRYRFGRHIHFVTASSFWPNVSCQCSHGNISGTFYYFLTRCVCMFFFSSRLFSSLCTKLKYDPNFWQKE